MWTQAIVHHGTVLLTMQASIDFPRTGQTRRRSHNRTLCARNPTTYTLAVNRASNKKVSLHYSTIAGQDTGPLSRALCFTSSRWSGLTSERSR